MTRSLKTTRATRYRPFTTVAYLSACTKLSPDLTPCLDIKRREATTYLPSSHEAVTIYKGMLEGNEDNKTIKAYLVEAEELLAEAYRDTLDNSQSCSQAICMRTNINACQRRQMPGHGYRSRAILPGCTISYASGY